MDLIQILSNPTKIRIMQCVQESGSITTKQIAQKMPDVPVPTLYRHVNEMLKAGFLRVEKENRVRGSLERVLAISKAQMTQTEHGDIAISAYQLLMGLYMQFYRYSERADVDPLTDFLMLRTTALQLTDKSYHQLLYELSKVIESYHAKEDLMRGKLRSLTLVSAPME